MSRLFLPFMLVVLFACAERKIESARYEEHAYSLDRYGSDNSLRLRESGRLQIKDSAETITHTYLLKPGNRDFTYLKLTERKSSDSAVVVNVDTCRLTGKFELEIDGKVMIMKRYLLDDPQAFDDESNVFVVPGYGVFMMKSKAWGQLMVFDRAIGFEKEMISKVLTDYELLLGARYD